MFAIYYLSQIHHVQSLILCIGSLQPLVYYRLNSVVLVYTPPPNNNPLLYTC